MRATKKTASTRKPRPSQPSHPRARRRGPDCQLFLAVPTALLSWQTPARVRRAVSRVVSKAREVVQGAVDVRCVAKRVTRSALRQRAFTDDDDNAIVGVVGRKTLATRPT